MPQISIEQAIQDIKDGRMVILVDDEDRENEGDLTMAARKDNPRSHQFHGQIRQGADLPVADRGQGRRTQTAHDGAEKHIPVRNGVYRIHRGQKRGHHGNLGRGPRHHGVDGRRGRLQTRRPRPAGPYLFPSAHGTAGSWCGWGRPRDRSTWRVWPG